MWGFLSVLCVCVSICVCFVLALMESPISLPCPFLLRQSWGDTSEGQTRLSEAPRQPLELPLSSGSDPNTRFKDANAASSPCLPVLELRTNTFTHTTRCKPARSIIICMFIDFHLHIHRRMHTSLLLHFSFDFIKSSESRQLFHSALHWMEYRKGVWIGWLITTHFAYSIADEGQL